MSSGSKIDFWFEFASTYSYLSAMRIEALADNAGVEVRWRPFLLGPIFASQGWTTSPFNIYEAKGRYMWRDMERLCQARGLALRQPDPFPQNSLAAARAALAVEHIDASKLPAFCRAVYAAEFGDGAAITDPDLLGRLADDCGLDGASIREAAGDPRIKQALRAQTEEAQALGIFGAPSFTTPDGELFWGDDRLEQALAWARSTSD